mmetsp:Transcript_42002/g.112198  ORF Transcript_42002/g.112198 Transcript_42002/m.112198 type:complete len:284 (-) Transcript_42002:235-1086(-)
MAPAWVSKSAAAGALVGTAKHAAAVQEAVAASARHAEARERVSVDEVVWFYVDPAGREFGPVGSASMRNWMLQGVFPVGGDLLLRMPRWRWHLPLHTVYPDLAVAFAGPPPMWHPGLDEGRRSEQPDDAGSSTAVTPAAGGSSAPCDEQIHQELVDRLFRQLFAQPPLPLPPSVPAIASEPPQPEGSCRQGDQDYNGEGGSYLFGEEIPESLKDAQHACGLQQQQNTKQLLELLTPSSPCGWCEDENGKGWPSLYGDRCRTPPHQHATIHLAALCPSQALMPR